MIHKWWIMLSPYRNPADREPPMNTRTTIRRAAFVLGDAVSLLCLLLIVGGAMLILIGVTA